jgi:hypothetical protein
VCTYVEINPACVPSWTWAWALFHWSEAGVVSGGAENTAFVGGSGCVCIYSSVQHLPDETPLLNVRTSGGRCERWRWALSHWTERASSAGGQNTAMSSGSRE